MMINSQASQTAFQPGDVVMHMGHEAVVMHPSGATTNIRFTQPVRGMSHQLDAWTSSLTKVAEQCIGYGKTHGWCLYCPGYYYGGMVDGACKDCRDIWDAYPRTRPASAPSADRVAAVRAIVRTWEMAN